MKTKKIVTNYVESADFDNAVSLTGYGKFHYEILTVCSICILTVGFQNGLSPYVFPAAQCELKLTSFQLGLLNVCFLLGGTLSCFLWGIVADLYGRRKVLIATHFLNASITIFCSVIPHTTSLVICRFLNGFLIGGPGSVVFSYISEFQPPKLRARSVCYCGLFFTMAWLVLPVFAYVVLPLNINYKVCKVFVMTPWRFFMILMAVPEIVVGVWFIRMPESPKFYVAKGDPRKALIILRRMYSENSGRSPELFPVKHLIGNVKIETNITEKIMCRGRTARTLKKMVNQIKSLFQPPLIKATALTCCIMFANMFGMFGLGLWLPDLFVRFEQYHTLHPNATITVKELSSLGAQAKNATCEPSFDSSVIRSTIAMALSSIAYNGISSWLSTKISTRAITMASLVLGGISSGCIYWMTTSMQNLVVASVFQATMITANMSIASMGVELFPTKVNGIAVCLIMCSGRIGAAFSNVVFGYLVDKHCEIPIFIVAIIVLIGGALCLVVPKDNTSQDNVKDIEISVISNRLKV